MSGGSFTIGTPEVLADPVTATGAFDHVTHAVNRLIQKFRGQPNIEAWVTFLAEEIQECEEALWSLFTERTIDTAVGAQLDALGAIVGQDRAGYSDDDYRRLIRARIATSRSYGLVRNLIDITQLVIDDDTATVVIDQQGIAAVVVLVDGVTAEAVADLLIPFLREAASAGVRIILETSSAASGAAFVFDGGVGLGFDDETPDAGGEFAAARE